MENWQEDIGTGHTHEPHEVTIQLDGLGRKLRDLPVEPIAPHDGAEGPVFVDESGRRSKKFRRIGWVLAAACAVYAITLVAALVGGNSSAPWMPGLGSVGEKQPDHVEIQPAPTDLVSTVPTPNAPPGVPAPSDSAGAALPLPSDGADDSSPLQDVPPPASKSPSPQEPAPDTATGAPAASPGAPRSDSPAPAVSPPVDAGPSTAPSGTPGQPVQEGAL
ncbi:hypothetical protein ACH46N_25145 [Streptomyces pristinaespiralis]|nr:hypothetical protein [Streptomyces pristinaespiralis]ALC22886.1 alpha-ketoglutarate decarboxylase [Streptomyces pristinaespiralis]QMU14571.1 hypothetical protein H3L99_13955 [Streptomyces pristinaespiralis]